MEAVLREDFSQEDFWALFLKAASAFYMTVFLLPNVLFVLPLSLVTGADWASGLESLALNKDFLFPFLGCSAVILIPPAILGRIGIIGASFSARVASKAKAAEFVIKALGRLVILSTLANMAFAAVINPGVLVSPIGFIGYGVKFIEGFVLIRGSRELVWLMGYRVMPGEPPAAPPASKEPVAPVARKPVSEAMPTFE